MTDDARTLAIDADDADSDRRHDEDGRDRIAQLELRQQRFGRRVWGSVVVIALTLVAGFAMQQDSRLDASEDACLRAQPQARLLNAAVLDEPEATRVDVAKAWPVVKDCRQAARDRTGIWLDLIPW